MSASFRVLSLAVIACLGCHPDRGSAAPIDQPEDPESPPTQFPMSEHFVQSEQIRNALIHGELEDAREPAQWLIDNLVTEDVPVRWRPHVPDVRRAAELIVEAQSIAEAAAGAGRMAHECGECHEAIGVAVAPTERPTPLEDDTTFAQMDRHAWAAERMWDGLIGPHDDIWVEGATLMRDAPLHPSVAPEPITSLGAQVHTLAEAAIELPADDRAEQYGKIITTCAGCHAQLESAAPSPSPE